MLCTAFDLLNFGRFLIERQVALGDIVPTDLFDYLDWQSKTRPARRGNVVRLAERRGPSPATMNRRIAAVRGMFEPPGVSPKCDAPHRIRAPEGALEVTCEDRAWR